MNDFSDPGLLIKALAFAAGKHRDQRRKGETAIPYINHPIDVVQVLWFEGGVARMDILAAAALHDTVEDTETTFDELEIEFGAAVTAIVRDVTDDRTLSKEQRKQNQVAHAPHLSDAAKQIKLGDKISNLRDLSKSPPVGWSDERKQTYFRWAKQVIDGLRGVNPRLESVFDKVYTDYMGSGA